MPIESICQGCARKLRVDDQFAGRQARCPDCRRVYTVPQLVGTEEEELVETEDPPRYVDQWQLRTEDHKVYGPVPREELDQWCAEGRIAANSSLRQGSDSNWQPATEVYPQIAAEPETQNPFAATATPAAAKSPVSPGHSTDYSTGQKSQAILVPHRGGMMVTLGILGVICCQWIGPVAWALSHTDLKAMEAGRMNPAGRGLTQAGMVLGVIGTAMLVSSFGWSILSSIF